jgi:hypothetical protein
VRKRWPAPRRSGLVTGAARRALAPGAALLILGALSACGDGGSAEALARVGGSPITETSVDHWVSVIDGATSATSSKPQHLSSRRKSPLSFLIVARWIFGEAAHVGLRVTDDEAQARLEVPGYGRDETLAHKQLPFERLLPTLLLKARGHADRLWLMKLAVLTSRLEARFLSQVERQITPAQIASYYRAHAAHYVLPERRDVEWIVTYSDASLAKAVREIRAGKNFLSVATRVSADEPTIKGMERHPPLEKELAKHVFEAKPHVLTGPFKQSANRYEFEVTRVIPARRRTLAQSEASIRRRLALGPASTAFAATLERKWAARTSCRAEDRVPGCGRDIRAGS